MSEHSAHQMLSVPDVFANRDDIVGFRARCASALRTSG
jgi:hypothetical protein